MDVVVDLGCSFDPQPAGDLEAQFHGELPTQCGEKGSTKLATKLATKALAKPPVCASEGFRVRGSGGVFSLNPGILNPDSWRLQRFCKRLIR